MWQDGDFTLCELLMVAYTPQLTDGTANRATGIAPSHCTLIHTGRS